MPRIAILVGEASGDQLGRGLIDALRKRLPDAEFVGITGPQMRAAGCDSWADYQQLAIMGLVEVLRHIPGLLALQRRVKARLRTERPDILIGIDAPDFNLRLERFARGIGLPSVHYVCPSVWAWRQGRVKTIRRACDRVLCLLPFEAGFLKQHAVDGVFIGHPMADEIGAGVEREDCRATLRLADRQSDHQPNHLPEEIVAVLPGSRGAEVALLGPLFLQTAQWLLERRPRLRFLVGAANDSIAATMTESIADAGLQDAMSVHVGATREVLGAADAVLLSSGTATLETMLMRRPMVVAYRMNAVTAWLARRLVKTEFAALPNLLAGRELVPEFLQDEAVPADMGAAVLHWLDDTQATAGVVAEFEQLAAQLRQGASERAAEAVVELLATRAKLL